jgi:hypothetical protein
MSKSDQKELKKLAKRLIDKKVLFPRSNIDYRGKLSNYQVRKINKALREIEAVADGQRAMTRDFVPLKGYKKYNKDNKLPPYMKGIFLNGGDRDNKYVSYRNGQVSYIRGNAERIYTPLNNWSERIMVEELKAAVIKLPTEGEKSLTANGRQMRNTTVSKDSDLEIQARMIFNKYKSMAAAGEKRQNGNLAAHPKKWGIGVLWEAPPKKDSAEEAWSKLTKDEKAGWTEGAKYFGTSKRAAFIKVFNTQ